MKNIKTFDNFFSNLFSRKSNGVYFWDNNDQTILEELGFINSSPGSSIGLYYYLPNFSEIIKKIEIKKNAEMPIAGQDQPNEDYFYSVTIHLIKKDKKILKDFDTINEVVKFVKQYIPEIDSDIKKYNL